MDWENLFKWYLSIYFEFCPYSKDAGLSAHGLLMHLEGFGALHDVVNEIANMPRIDYAKMSTGNMPYLIENEAITWANDKACIQLEKMTAGYICKRHSA